MAANPTQEWYSIGEVADLSGMSASWIRKEELRIGMRPLRIGKARIRSYTRTQLEMFLRAARPRGDS